MFVVVYGIIQRHKGHIHVKFKANEGSAFYCVKRKAELDSEEKVSAKSQTNFGRKLLDGRIKSIATFVSC